MSASNEDLKSLPEVLGTQRERLWEARTGWIVGIDGVGLPVVEFEGNVAGPLVGRSTVALEPDVLRAAVQTRRRVELRFEDGDPGQPIIVGLMPNIEPADVLPNLREIEESDVDGVRVIRGQDELVLQCGKASITLRRNGKIIIKGTYVETNAEGINRLKGGSIQIN